MARIVEVATTRLTRRLHTPFVTALRRTEYVVSIAVRVTDADGVAGYGEGPQVWRVTGESLASIEACVREPLAETLLGWDPLGEPTGAAADRLARAVVGNGGARAACETAVLDLVGRRLGRPLAELAGGTVGTVATDVTLSALGGFGPDVDASGFHHTKVKVGLDPTDVERVAQVFARTGVPVRIDANQAWDLETATATLEALLDRGVALEFAEQPLPAWDLRGHAELRRRLGVRIVLDESVFTVHDLRRAVEADAGDVVNIKLAKCGGIHPGLGIAAEARAAGLEVMVGSMMESELGVSAAAALASAVAPEAVHDLDAAWWSIDPSDGGSPYSAGSFRLDAAPGSTRAATRVTTPDDLWTACGEPAS